MNQQIGNEKLPLEIERRKLGNRRVEKQKMKTGELFAAADKADKAGGKAKSNKSKKGNKPSFGPNNASNRGGSFERGGRGGSRGGSRGGRGGSQRGRGRGRA